MTKMRKTNSCRGMNKSSIKTRKGASKGPPQWPTLSARDNRQATFVVFASLSSRQKVNMRPTWQLTKEADTSNVGYASLSSRQEKKLKLTWKLMMKAATNNDLQRAAASIEDGLKCNTCKKQFKDMNEIRKHRKAEHPTPPHKPCRNFPSTFEVPACKAGTSWWSSESRSWGYKHNFLYYMIGWCFMTKYTFAHRVLNTVWFLDPGNLSKYLAMATEVATVVWDLPDRGGDNLRNCYKSRFPTKGC